MYTLVKSGSLPFQHGLNLRPPGPSQPSDPNQRTPGLQRLLLPHSTATPTSPPQLPPQRTDETHRPAINGLSTIKMIAIGVGVVGGIVFIVFTYMLIRRYLYRRQPTRPQSPNSTNRDSDVEMLPRFTQYQPTSRVPSSHSVIGRDDGFRATPVQGHPYIPTATQHQIPRRPVPAHGPALPHQPTHWPTGEVEQPAQQNVTWMRGPGYRRME
jgi:hypothetical protein